MEQTIDTLPAQPIQRRRKAYFIWRRFQEWNRGSLLFYPFTFMLAAVILVLITRQVDSHLVARSDVRDWWLATSSTGVNITSLVASSVISLLAIVFSISLVALQLANQQYSPQVISIFERASSTKVALSLFIATFVYSFILLIEVLRTNLEQITIISIFTNVLLILACLIVFIVFMKSIMLMIRVTHIIAITTDRTREAIDENLPQKEAYVECQSVRMEAPRQVIRYTCLPSMPFSKRYAQGVLRALQHSALVQIASIHNCTLQVLPHLGDYVNEGDPIVEVYGEDNLQAEQVLKAFYVEPERGLQQDPAYGIRMLVDIALKALSPAVNAPTTAREVVLRLTNLLAMIAQRPEHSGAFADRDHQIRLLQPVTTWEAFVELAFDEILHYGKHDPQTRQSLADAIDYLLENVPEACKPPLIRKRVVLSEP